MKQAVIAGDTRSKVTGAKAKGRRRVTELRLWRLFQELPQRARGSVHPPKATLEKRS